MKIQKPSKKVVIATLSFVLFISLVFGGYKAIEATTRFFSKNTILFSRPVVVRFSKPLEIVGLDELDRRNKEAELVNSITDRVIEEMFNPVISQPETQLINYQPFSSSEFFDRVWSHETTRGRDKTPGALHMFCRGKGLWNEIGYNPQAKFCFKDRQEAELFVAYYIKKNCDGRSFNQCLCLWNTGKMTDTCAYAEGNLSMAN